MILELARDFADALAAMPADHPRRRMLRLLEEAVRRDIHFVARHPTTLFQCLWNTCWWYDCPAAEAYCEPGAMSSAPETVPWKRPGAKLHRFVEHWHQARQQAGCGLWVRSLRPVGEMLGGGQVAVLRGHECPVQTVDFSPDGRWIASCSAFLGDPKWQHPVASNVPIWHMGSGRQIDLSVPPEVSSRIKDDSIRIWDARSGEEVAHFVSRGGPVTCIAFSHDGTRLACSGSRDGAVRILDCVTGENLGRFEGHAATVTRVAFSPDDRRIASASWDGTVRVREADTGADIVRFEGHKGPVAGIAFSPDGKWIASGSSTLVPPGDNSLRVWDSSTGKEVARLDRSTGQGIMAVAFSPCGRRVAAGTYDHKVLLCECAPTLGEQVVGLHDSHVLSVAFSPDGRLIVSASIDATVRVWDGAGAGEKLCLRGHQDVVNSAVFSPDGQRIASASADLTVRLWSLARVDPQVRLSRHWGDIVKLGVAAERQQVVSAALDGTVRVWDPSGRCIGTSEGHGWSRQLEVSPDARRVVSTDGHALRVWDPGGQSGPVLLSQPSTDLDVTCLALCYTRPWIVCGYWDGRVRILSNADGSEIQRLAPLEKAVAQSFQPAEGRVVYAQEVTCLALSDDEERLAGGHADGTVRLWDLEQGEAGRPYKHRSFVRSVAFSPDGSCLAAGTQAGEVLLWQRPGNRLDLDGPSSVFGPFGAGIPSLAFSPDGTTLAGVSGDRMVIIGDFASGRARTVDGEGDARAMAGPRSTCRFWALRRGTETVLVDASTGQVAGWFTAALAHVRRLEREAVWTGAEGSNMFFISVVSGVQGSGS